MSMEERGSTKKVWAHRKAGWTKTREMWDIAFLRYFVKSLNLWKFISDDKRLWVICIQTGVHQLADHIIEGRKPYIRCFIENLKKVSPPIHWGGNHTSDILLRINKSFIFNTFEGGRPYMHQVLYWELKKSFSQGRCEHILQCELKVPRA